MAPRVHSWKAAAKTADDDRASGVSRVSCGE